MGKKTEKTEGVRRTLTIPANATFEDLYGVTFAEWRSLPTIHAGHFDDLKYESKTFRVWVSRMTVADYDGDVNAYMKDRLAIETVVEGRWWRLDRHGKLEGAGRRW